MNISANEATTVLNEVRDLLLPHSGITGQIEFESDRLLTKIGGKTLLIRARIENDSSIHPDIAHVHIVVESEHADLQGHLDACVIGVDSDRQQALKYAAGSWFTGAAGPIFSIFHARPVLNAVHFGGSEPWGVEGAHGFAGPLCFRLGGNGTIAAPLSERSLFQFAHQMAPPGIVHLVKASVSVDSTLRCCRTIEVDGHAATFCDKDWEAQVPLTEQIIAGRFATFHYADQPSTVTSRQLLDDMIREFVQAYSREQDMSKAFDQLIKNGRPAAVADRVFHFLTLALGRALITNNMPFKHAVTYHRVLPSGEMVHDIPLMNEPAFARGLALAGELARSQLESVKQLAMCSAEIDAINNLLHAGSKLEDCRGAPFIVPDFGTSNQTFEKSLRSSRPQRPSSTKAKSPWWKFW